jgi:hypothetical protein
MTESSANEHSSEQTSHTARDHWEKGFQEAKEAFSEAVKGFEKVAQSFAPPSAACDHFRNSRVEFLKGMRVMIDHQIENLSKGAQPRGGTRVTVE